MNLLPLFAIFLQSADDGLSPSSEIPIDVAGLVLRAQAGESDAVGALYQMYSPAIYRYVAYRTPTPADAEDLTADVFIRMVEGLKAYRMTQVPFEAWLYRIAAARIADFYRVKGRRSYTELNDTLAAGDPLPEDNLEQRQLFEMVQAALQQLSEEHQSILVLRFVERKSHEEVAAILGKSMTAVKSAQHRALNQLASLLGSDGKIRHYLRGKNG